MFVGMLVWIAYVPAFFTEDWIVGVPLVLVHWLRFPLSKSSLNTYEAGGVGVVLGVGVGVGVGFDVGVGVGFGLVEVVVPM